jgi:transcriptional regulator with XRE-family HTH domain
VSETRLHREIRLRRLRLRQTIGPSIRDLREDAGLSMAAIAKAAGVHRSHVSRIEVGQRGPSLSTLVAIATVLGADLSVRLYPTTGPQIRDRIQAAMVESMLSGLDPRWIASPEVPVYRPSRGVIDLVLSGRREPVVIAAEFHSELRRLEQQVRWHREKEGSLASADLWRHVAADQPPSTSRLLVLRSTRTLRELAQAYEQTLRSVYPARCRDAVLALAGPGTRWPGPAIVWMLVEGKRARLMDGPPRGVRLGR